jgi:hypothetical protein
MASICGIIVLAFPISMIVEKFATAQEEMSEKRTNRRNSKLLDILKLIFFNFEKTNI